MNQLLAAIFVILSATINAQEPVAGVNQALLSAADNGSAVAQYAVGAALEQQGDIRRAIEYYRKAADSGYGGAEFKLGELAEKGLLEGDASQVTAADWYARAVEHGNEAAGAALTRLRSKGVEEQVVEEQVTDKSAPEEGEAPAGAQQPAGKIADEPKLVLPSPPVSSPTVDALSTPSQQNTTTQGTTTDLLPRILLIAALTLAIGIPYWLGVSSVRRCHRSGWLVYRRRREVAAWSLLPLVVVMVFAYLADGFPTAQGAIVWLSPVVWLGLQWVAASRANPGLGASSLFVVWRARVGAAFFALFVSWLMFAALQSKPQPGKSHVVHQIEKAATLALLAWVGSSYLNFVCYPDELKYPESAWATA